MIEAKIKDLMGSDRRVFEAAKVTMLEDDFAQYETDPTKLINFLARERHVTPFRHPKITLQCTAPIFVVRQLGKHQVGFDWNERSMRYRDTVLDFYRPEFWRVRPENLHSGSEDTVHPNNEYWMRSYERYLRDGEAMYNAMIADHVAPEQARMILPQSMITKWVWTGSLWGFLDVYRQRTSLHAQKEVRDFAGPLGKILNEHFPISFAAYNKHCLGASYKPSEATFELDQAPRLDITTA